MDSKVEFLFLNEEDMIKAGVLDADRAVDTIGGGHNTPQRGRLSHGRQST